MGNTNEKSRIVSIKLPADLDQALTGIAYRMQVTRSAVVREALRAYADRSGSGASALAGDLIGSLNGPRDLSTNKKYLKGFGK